MKVIIFNQLNKPLILLLAIFVSSSAYAELKRTQLTFRTGMIQGSYSSPFEGDNVEDVGGTSVQDDMEGGGFSVVPSLDFGFEYFTQPRKSYSLRATIAMDPSTGTMHYNYFGLGQNFYFKGIGLPTFHSSSDSSVTINSQSRQYFGYSVGMSRVSVVSFGPSLAAVSTGIDFGGHWGYTRQMGKAWALNTELGASYAYGISSVSSAGVNIKILFGASFQL